MQLARVYPPEAQLASLVRTVRLDRTPPRGAVDVSDTFAFREGPGICESVMICLNEPKLDGPGRIVISQGDAALAVRFDPQQVTGRVDSLGMVDYSRGTWELWRIVLAPAAPAREGVIAARVEPLV